MTQELNREKTQNDDTILICKTYVFLVKSKWLSIFTLLQSKFISVENVLFHYFKKKIPSIRNKCFPWRYFDDNFLKHRVIILMNSCILFFCLFHCSNGRFISNWSTKYKVTRTCRYWNSTGIVVLATTVVKLQWIIWVKEVVFVREFTKVQLAIVFFNSTSASYIDCIGYWEEHQE